MAEVRTTSATGGQKGVKPERFSLMPRRGLAAISRVFGFGAAKYADHNWRHGYEWSKSLDALERHLQAFKDGETYDEESGLPHLAHAGFHILVLLTWLDEQGEGADNPMDDRWPAAMERVRRAKAELAEREAAEQDEALGDFHSPPEPQTPPPFSRWLAETYPEVGPDLLRKRPPVTPMPVQTNFFIEHHQESRPQLATLAAEFAQAQSRRLGREL